MPLRPFDRLIALCCLVAVAGVATPAAAQFRAIIPSAIPLKERQAHIYRDIYALEVKEQLSREARVAPANAVAATDTVDWYGFLRRARKNVCDRFGDTTRVNACESAIGDNDQLERNRNPASTTIKLLPMALPVRHSTAAIARLTNGPSSMIDAKFLDAAAASVGQDVKAVTTDIVSGVSGRTFVDFSTMLLTVDIKEGDSLRRDTLRTNKSRLTEALFNGGSIVAQFGWPIFATQGPTLRRAGHFTVHAGGLGSITKPDSLQAAGGATFELALASSLFTRDEADTTTRDLTLAFRTGYFQSERSILVDGDVRRFGYIQVGIGVRRGKTFSIAALISTTLRRELDEHVPRLQLVIGTAP